MINKEKIINKKRTISKYTLQSTSGITLVALVVTIVVLLILAGITVTMLFGENGIIKKAQEAKEATERDQQETEQGLQDLVDQMGNILNGNGSGEIEAEIGSVETAEGSAIQIKLSISGTKVKTPPIPSGFSYKEGSLDDGYVITDGTNEFVWIPVAKNQKISLTVTSEEDISSINLYDSTGTVILTVADGDVETNFENTDVTPTKNGCYIASVVTASGTAAVKELTVQSLYAQTTSILTQQNLSILELTSIEEAETIFASYGTDVDAAIANVYQQYSFQGDEDTVDFSQSVEKNGGFYIGRYEAGAPTARTSGSATATAAEIITANGTPVCNANQTAYNYITQTQAQGLAESMYQGKSFTCSLLTGSAWDRTLGFLTETGTNNKTMPQVYDDGEEWGNYNNSNFDVINTSAKYSEDNGTTYKEVEGTYTKPADTARLLTTGATDRNSAKNIYDLAGNVTEWTLMTYYDSGDRSTCVVSRGGSYNGNGGNAAYSRGHNDATFYDSYHGFRPALYL